MKLRLLLLDNYDSFTWNLAHGFEELGAEVDVRLNDRVTVDRVRRRGYRAVVISPGPGRPEAAGISLDLVRDVAGRIPLLGVCLGHQAVAQVYGGRIVQATRLMHGKTSPVFHDGTGLFRGLSRPFEAMRYHSLVVEPSSLSGRLEVSARTQDGVIMALRHREHPLYGVQFHPESVLTREGQRLLANFLSAAADWWREGSRAA